MVSLLSLYETSSTNTNFPQAIFLADIGDALHIVDIDGAQPGRAEHHPDRGRSGIGAWRKSIPDPIGASSPGAWACLRGPEFGQPLFIRVDRGARGVRLSQPDV